MDVTLSPPRDDDEIVRAFETAAAVRLAGESVPMEEALVACTHLHHLGWNVLALLRRAPDDEHGRAHEGESAIVGWVGWVPVLGDRWCSLVQVAGNQDQPALAGHVLCWLAHSGAGLRGNHGADGLESLFTPWEDRLASACAGEVRRRQWDPRAPRPTWTTRWDPTVQGTVQALTWTQDPLPHRCLRRRPEPDAWAEIRPLTNA